MIDFGEVYRDAVLSDDGEYRYLLRRAWNLPLGQLPEGEWEQGVVTWIMLNPSTADASVDDPTIRRCMGFTDRWGYGCMQVVNLFALRSTDPRRLAGTRDPVGPRNHEYLRNTRTDLVVAAWGTMGTMGVRRIGQAQVLLGLAGRPLHVLGLTKDGYPRHPLYVRGDATPTLWT